MRPKPSTPSVLPSSSTPPKRERSQRPCISAACACGTLRAIASSSATVCSAAETMFDCGALQTTIPRRVAAATSTLSTPTPARPITRSASARAISSASTWVAERTTSASASPIAASSAARSSSEPSTTSPAPASSSMPAGAIVSATRIFGVIGRRRARARAHRAPSAGRAR
jgi:hypothetical protein